MGDLILYFIFLIPLYAVLIWTYFCPEESMLFGQRWMYKDEPEYSETAIRYTKFAASAAVFGITMFLLFFIIENYLIRLVIILGFLFYVFYGVYKLIQQYLDS